MSLYNAFAGTIANLVPLAPTIGSASLSMTNNGSVVDVTYSAPTLPENMQPITSYTAFAVEDPTKTVTVAGNPGTISVTGLTVGSTYTFRVYASNANGRGYSSGVSNSVTTAPIGSTTLATPGTGFWTVPAGVTSFCVVCIGAGGNAGSNRGGGGGGGALAYGNNISASPGTAISYQVGVGGGTTGLGGTGATWFNSTATLLATGGASGSSGSLSGAGGGGGGAGGYISNGGAGGSAVGNLGPNVAGGLGGSSSGSLRTGGGRGGDGGSGYNLASPTTATNAAVGGGTDAGAGGSGGALGAKGGGGVSALGSSGVDLLGNATTAGTATASGGTGAATDNGGSYGGSSTTYGSQGGAYGAGAGADGTVAAGYQGLIRIVWGPGRSFPSTFVGSGYP